ncbi:MAG: hypothetical protein GY866_03080 [Proteobacteria bacterium]|nr:hypothetical protein [Pseudomonadota bacterium]
MGQIFDAISLIPKWIVEIPWRKNVLFLITLVFPFSALSATVDLEYTLGFNGIFQVKKWTPLSIVLENRGRPIDGLLEVVVTSGSEYGQNVRDTVYSTMVEMPSDSKKAFSFTVLIESYVHPLIVRLKQDGGTIVTSALNLRPHYTEKRLIPFLGENPSLNLPMGLGDSVRSVHVDPRFLPETWYGYDGVEMLVLHAESLARLRAVQFVALTEWMRQGGFLVMAARLNYGSLSQARVKRFLTAEVSGIKRMARLRSLESYCRESFTGSEPFLVLNSEVADSETLLEENGIPIMVGKAFGNGRTLFLPFDYRQSAFVGWKGKNTFWKKVLMLKPSTARFQSDIKRKRITSVLLSEIPDRFPRFAVIFTFLLIYVIVLATVFYRIKNNPAKKAENLAVLLMVVGLFTLTSFWGFYYQDKQKSLTYNSLFHVIKTGRNSQAAGKNFIGLSSFQNGFYEMDFGPGRRAVVPIRPDGPKDPDRIGLTLHAGRDELKIGIPMRRWSQRFLETDFLIDFPIEGEAFRDERGLTVTVENGSPHALIGCLLFFDDRLFYWGEVPLGEKQTRRFPGSMIDRKEPLEARDLKAVLDRMAWGDTGVLLPAEARKSVVEDLLSSVGTRYRDDAEAVLLFGWIDTGVSPINFTPPSDADGEVVTLLEWAIPSAARLTSFRTD